MSVLQVDAPGRPLLNSYLRLTCPYILYKKSALVFRSKAPCLTARWDHPLDATGIKLLAVKSPIQPHR